MFSRTLSTKRHEDYVPRLYAQLRQVPGLGLGLATGEYPPINVYRSSEKALILSELTGVTADDIELSVSQNILTLKGSTERENLKVQKNERFSGPFFRSIELPFVIDADRVVASLNKGVLRIELARPGKNKAVKKIAISKQNHKEDEK